MTLSIAEIVTKEAIAMLIDLAERGEIDPWDVPAIEVIDRCLARLASDDRRDLYESGQAILYASMLVLLKARTLEQAQLAYDIAEDGSDEEAGELLLDHPRAGLPPNLDRTLRRRAVALPPERRRVTLDELIAQLEEIAAIVDRHETKHPRPLQPKQSRRAAMRAIAQLAHKENLSEMVLELEEFFLQHAIEGIDLAELAKVFDDVVGVFWGLLFLSAQSKVELFQAEFYGSIQVVPIANGQAAAIAREVS